MPEIKGDSKSFWVENPAGERIAEVTFVMTGDDLAIIDHTWVDDSLRGQGVGRLLVAAVVNKMRKEHRKIIPLCPFAHKEFDTRPEYADIRA